MLAAMDEPFVDYYEVLQVSPNADTETIARIFRHLAKRYHPDNPQTGDSDQFSVLVKAHRILTDPEERAAYDLRYQQGTAQRWALARDAADGDGFEYDRTLRARLLSLLYVQRRREPVKPGLGNLELSRILGCPIDHIEFHLWYLRQKKWAELTENGTLAITAEGVDRVEDDQLLVRRDRLLAERSADPEPEPPPRLQAHTERRK
jgi:hypothetical protein